MTFLSRLSGRNLLPVVVLCLTLSLVSCGGDSGKNIKIDGVKGPTVNVIGEDVLISFVFEGLQIEGGLRYNIPEYDESYVEISPDLETGGTLLAFSISLDDVFSGDLGQLDPQTLPGGRALPGIASGELPAVAFTIEEFYGISLYLGKDVYGVFVPFKIGVEDAILTFKFYIGKKAMGNISLVGEDSNGENSGILLMLNLKGYVKKKLKKLAKRY